MMRLNMDIAGFNNFEISVPHLIGAVIVILSVLLLYTPVRNEIAFQFARVRTGCRRVTRYPHRDRIWGQDLITLRQKAFAGGNLFKQYQELFQQLGKTWEEAFYHERIINTMDVANIKYVAATKSEVFTRMPHRLAASKPLLGTGIFNSVGSRWRNARELYKPAFHRAEVGNIDMLQKHTDRFLSLLPADGSSFDAQPLLRRLFLDIGTEYLFGKSTDSLSPKSSFDTTDFLTNLDSALSGLQKRRSAGMMRFKLYLDKTWPEQIRKVHAFIDDRVASALQATEELWKRDGEEYTTEDETKEGVTRRKKEQRNEVEHDRHILLHEMARQIRDPIELRYQALNIFLPGRDVTASVVSNALFHLARHPAEWQHLRSQPHPETSLTFESIKAMTPYLDVINETMRLTSPGGRSSKWASEDSILPTGGGLDGTEPIFVPKGTGICLLTASLHRDPDIWGEDANEFRPSRMRERRKPWEFLPFLGGPGICPAQQLALIQAVYVLYRLVSRFGSIENRDPTLEFVERIRMSVESRNGSQVALLPV